MARSAATTVEGYLDELPTDRRADVAALRELVLRRLPAGYEERMNWGMISYELPLARYPDTYNGQPLVYAALAAQKGFYAVYLTGAERNADAMQRLRDAFAAAGTKLDMGKSCLRLKRLDDVPLDAIGDVIASLPPEAFIDSYEASRSR